MALTDVIWKGGWVEDGDIHADVDLRAGLPDDIGAADGGPNGELRPWGGVVRVGRRWWSSVPRPAPTTAARPADHGRGNRADQTVALADDRT